MTALPWIIVAILLVVCVLLCIRSHESDVELEMWRKNAREQQQSASVARVAEFDAIELAKTNGVPRSPQWPKVRRDFIAAHPNCEGCGTTDNLEAHHRKPFHLDKSKELDPANLITLCEKSGHDCHFRLGHEFDWKAFNTFVQHDAEESIGRVKARRYT